MGSLFEAQAPRPLADRLRPTSIADVVGQAHLIAEEGSIGRMLAAGRISSIILWGPPGTGKTSIARLLAQHADLHFEPMSAVFSGVADLRRVFESASERRVGGRGTLLFIDEIHRFNRAQQDGFLPYVEDGTVTLVGATTENPSFELNPPLLSRCRVLILNRLGDSALAELLGRAERALGRTLPLTEQARMALRAMADGDGRYLLNTVEALADLPASPQLDEIGLARAVQRRLPQYDKRQEGHYNLISALHKSLRGSDPDAALYWFCRMIAGGEDPNYIGRRLVRFAVEDVGLADPQALQQAVAAWQAYERLGSPEGDLALGQCVVYLATAPRSNALYRAHDAADRTARESGSLMPPKHILNAPTRLMREIGYGAAYQYDHDAVDGFSGQNYFPEDMTPRKFYRPTKRGRERDIGRHLQRLERLRRERQNGQDVIDCSD